MFRVRSRISGRPRRRSAKPSRRAPNASRPRPVHAGRPGPCRAVGGTGDGGPARHHVNVIIDERVPPTEAGLVFFSGCRWSEGFREGASGRRDPASLIEAVEQFAQPRRAFVPGRGRCHSAIEFPQLPPQRLAKLSAEPEPERIGVGYHRQPGISRAKSAIARNLHQTWKPVVAARVPGLAGLTATQYGPGRVIRAKIIDAVDRQQICKPRPRAIDPALDRADRALADFGRLLV